MEELKEAIKNATLTRTGRRIAEYILDHDTESCFMTSTDLAMRLNVSEASVVRFSRSLGFSGYTDFQKNLQASYTEKVSRVPNAVTVPHERLMASLERPGDDYISTFLINTEKNIESVLKNNSRAVFDQAIELLIKSRKKFILGTRANSGVAAYFFLLLKHMLPNVYSTADSSVSVIDHLCDMEEGDCLILFSFPRYSDLDRQAVQMAEDSKTSLLVITDRPSAPLAQYATVLLTVDVDTNSFFNSYVGVQLVMEILCAGISQQVGSSNGEKLKKIDRYLEKLGTF